MGTGACGVCCDVCRLNVAGVCSSCGSGISVEGKEKLAAQERLFGMPCPVLACANLANVEFCMRDCNEFPCDNFANGPYPFSEGFLNMQKRRRREMTSQKRILGVDIEVPLEYWDQIFHMDRQRLCMRTLSMAHPDGVVVMFLHQEILVDIVHRNLKCKHQGMWKPLNHGLLELVLLVYLLNASDHVLTNELIGVNELRDAHFFSGPHELKISHLLQRYGQDAIGFGTAAQQIGGRAVDMADVAYRIPALPKIPLYYLLWVGDEEFEANLSILFDRSIDQHLSADAIWGLVNLVSDCLYQGKVLVSSGSQQHQ